MRIGDATFVRRFLDGLESSRARSAEALAGLADGKRVRVASDDPAAARMSLALRARLTRLEGLERSAASGRADLATLDRVLGEVVSLVSNARSVALAGASFPSDTANGAHALEIDSLREQILNLANTSQNGRYLFSGTETLTTPFVSDGTYAGNDVEARVPIGPNEQVGVTLSGRKVFQDAVDVLGVLADTAQALRDGRADDVAAALPDLKIALDHLIAVRSEVGLRAERAEITSTRQAEEALGLVERIVELEDIDLDRVVVELQASMSASNALSAAAARVLGRSLFDFLG